MRYELWVCSKCSCESRSETSYPDLPDGWVLGRVVIPTTDKGPDVYHWCAKCWSEISTIKPVFSTKKSKTLLPDFMDRVRSEKEDLDEKIVKLKLFIEGRVFQGLNANEQERMVSQLEYMYCYSRVLGERIYSFGSGR